MPDHGLRGDQGIDDRLFGAFHGGPEQRVDRFRRQQRHRLGRIAGAGLRTAGGAESDEQISRSVITRGAGAPHAERAAARDALQLQRQQGRVGRDHDDQRAGIVTRVWRGPGEFADRDAANGQLLAPPEIGLHQRAERKASIADRKPPRRAARATLVGITAHAGTAIRNPTSR